MLRPRARRVLLGFGFEKELIHFTDGQTLGEIIERTMFSATVMAMALSFATGGKALHDGSAEKVGGDVELAEEELFALAKRQGGFACVIENPRHVYG